MEKIPRGYNLIEELREQQSELLNGCGPAVCSSVKVELDSASKRIDNLEAALRTWSEFLTRIKSVSDLYDEMTGKIEEMMRTIHVGIDSETGEIARSDHGEYAAVYDLEKIINALKVSTHLFSIEYWFLRRSYLTVGSL